MDDIFKDFISNFKMQQMTFFHLYYFPCEKQPAASPLSSPEEVAEEFLFIRGAVVLDHQSEASGLVLVLGQTELSEVPLIRDVVGVKPLLHLSQSAVHLLVFISAMEEHHLATEHLLDWALVEGGLGEVPLGVVALVGVLLAPLEAARRQLVRRQRARARREGARDHDRLLPVPLLVL